MALIRCPECDREVSDIAKVCPHCGFPLYIIENVEPQNQTNADNTVYYRRPTNPATVESERHFVTPLEEKIHKKKMGFWIILFIVAMFAGCGACSTDLEPQEQELTAEDFDTYDEYVESEKIVSDESTVELVEEQRSVEETIEEPKTEAVEVSMEEYIAECQEYNYKDVLRNPSDYVGQKVKIVVEISSVHEASWLYNEKYYFGYSDDGSGYFMDNRYAIIDKRYDNSLKLLEKDVILVYGEIAEPEETESLIVNSEELFTIDMRYVELLDE